jgi:aspartyl-tRNA(Asn)/glutamyl-tRNA(Gln) amidotransferase subunit A
MRDIELAFETVSSLSAKLSEGAVKASYLVDLFLERIEAIDPVANTFIEVTADDAREAARAIDAPASRSPLAGIPYASKDLIDVAGVRTTAGSRVLADNVAGRDAEIIARVREAGAISLGKLNLHEFAYGATGENDVYGTPANPYDQSRLAGGSSSGSAAAVALGLVPAAFGTDTGGSVRAPAALCGLVGLKPTLGRVSTRGVIPYCWTLDHIGTVTRTVEDAALLLTTIAGFDPDDPGSSNEPLDDYVNAANDTSRLDGLTIGIPRAFFFERADGEILDAAERTLRMLEKAGAKLVDVDLPSMEHTRTVSLTIQMPEALSYHARYLESRGSLYGNDFRAGLALGQCILAEHYIRAKRHVTQYRQQVDKTFQEVDVLLTPATPVIAPEIGAVNVEVDGVSEPAGNAITRFTSFFNMTGHPAVTVPSAMHSMGLPMGVQLVARQFEETMLLRVAARAAQRIDHPEITSQPVKGHDFDTRSGPGER